MNKTLAMIIKETKIKLANVCNESGLPPTILDLILQGIYSEVHDLAERQALEDEKSYVEALRNKDIENSNIISEDNVNE